MAEINCEKLKKTLNYILDDLHDILVSVTDESEEFYKSMWESF